MIMALDSWATRRKEQTWQEEKLKLSVADAFYLKDLGVTEITINYSGGGDSGQIDSIEYANPKVKGEFSTIPERILKAVESEGYRLLNGIDDWYNNEGGYGTIVINVSDFEYAIDAHYYEEAPSTYNEETGDYDYDYDNQGEWSEGYGGNLEIKL